MASKKNTPFSVFTAADTIKKHKAKNQSAGTGAASMPNYTQKATPQPSSGIKKGSTADHLVQGVGALAGVLAAATKSTVKAKVKSMNKKKK